MQTCSECNATSPDTARACVHCQADLSQYSTTAVALKHLQDNPRVKAIRITVAYDACPYCYQLLKTYPKDHVPALPHQGCSHDHGCRCFYEPVLEEAALVGETAQ